MSFTTPLPTPTPTPSAPNQTLLNANPQLYAAVNAGQFTGSSALFLNNLQQVINLDQKLNANHDLGASRAQYHNLDSDVKGALQFINPTAGYQQSNPSFLQLMLLNHHCKD